MKSKNAVSILRGDEGMWLLNSLPVGRFEKLYGFTPPKGWAEYVQRAAVRMNNGGSASFISSDGLLVTNHHVAESVVDDLSTSEKNYLKDGFYAVRQKDEIPAKGLEVNVLWEIEDVTGRVKSVVKQGMNPAKAFEARRAEIAKIEKESKDATGLRSNVTTLYQGGRYHLYRFKKYTDVRLVFAPEKAIAGFGGDIDNYTYPRYDLDVSFLRVYENGKPLKTENFFRWSGANPKEGDVLFVAGHPGNTDRLSTVYRVKSLRDSGIPYQLNLLRRQEISLQQFSGQSSENKRRAHHSLHGVQNYRKRLQAQLDALQAPSFMDEIVRQEEDLRRRVMENRKLNKAYGDAWKMVEESEKHLLKIRDRMNLFEGAQAFDSQLFKIARDIIRLAAEDKEPNEKRLPEYRDSNRESLLHGLYSDAPF